MGVAEIVGFAVCWLIVATVMLWGVFTERSRGDLPHLFRRQPDWPPAGYTKVAQTDWIVLESMVGGTPEVAAQACLLAAALLASRGIDLEAVPPGDIRTEVTSAGDGTATTRILVRAGAMHATRKRH
jgi:hypothetical protein